MITNTFLFTLLITTFYIVIKKWSLIKKALNLKNYSQEQKVHTGETSRLGGLIIYIFLWIFYFVNYYENDLFYNILISSIPFFIVSTLEDLFQNTSPIFRIFSMIISCIVFFYISGINLPIIEIPLMGDILNSSPFSYIFYIFTIVIIMNGSNLIDGMNGLLTITFLFQLVSLYFLFSTHNDIEILYLLENIIYVYLIFLLFNFPFGKIFLGDFGAYFVGFIVSIFTIIFFGRYHQEYTWLAILLLFYPSMELLFSFIRKKIHNFNPFDSDSLHIHSIIYKNFLKKNLNTKQANYLTTIVLLPMWLIPTTLIFFVINSLPLITFSLITLSILYLLIYNFFNNN